MFTTLVKNRICRGSNGFYCTICDVDIANEENASKHSTEDDKHLEKIETIISPKNIKIDENKCIELINNGIVMINSREYKCTFCSCSIPKLDHIPEHITGKKHLTKRRKVLSETVINKITDSITFNDKNEKNQDSCIIHSSNGQNKIKEESFSNNPPKIDNHSVYCNSCKSNLESDSALLYHKMFHLSQKSGSITDIISFLIKENGKTIYCLICDCIMKSEENLQKHLKEARHQKRLIILCCPNNSTIMNMMYLNSTLYPNIAIPPNMNNIYNTLNAEFNRYLYYLGCNIYYSAFQTAVQNNHMNIRYREQETVSTNTLQAAFQQTIQQNSNNSIFPTYFCFICNMNFIDENLLFLHYNYDYIHKYRMEAINLVLKDKNMKFVTYLNNEVIKCSKCQIQLTELNGAVAHLFEIQHVMEKQVESEKPISNNATLINNIDAYRNMYVCPLCKINVTHDYMMVQHLESDYHKNRVQEHCANINGASFEKVIFFCPLCKMNFFNDKILLEHFYHNHGFKNMIQMNNMILANSASMYLSINNTFTNTFNPEIQQHYDAKYGNINSMPTNDINHTFYNLMNLNLNKDCSQKLSDMNKEKTSFNHNKDNDLSSVKICTKNFINFSPRYVKLCVEIGEENIFKIHPERLRKLKLGISLSFPYNSNRGCIPCGYEISSDPQHLYEHLRTEEHEKNLQEMEDNDEYFENYRDQFSDLELAKSYMYEESDEWIKCLACDSKIENCNKIIHKHINSKSHMEKYLLWKKSADKLIKLFNNMFENLWYYIEKFFCNICCAQFEFEVDYAKHLENPKHLKEVEKRILRKQCLQFDCCIICSSYWYAKSNHHTIHCSKDSHKYVLKSREFAVPEMTDLAKNLLTSVEETVNKLLIESDEAIHSQRETKQKILESIELIIKSKYPQAKTYLFGSRISYLCFKDSNLNIYIDCKSEYEKLKSIDECKEQLLTIEDCFYKHQDTWITEEIILHTRVPTLKLRHRFTNLNCDISFNNGLCVEKSKILSYYINACLPCRKLILYLKKWNILCRLSGAKGLSTFAISWLVIFYLQVKEYLPSVQQLIQLENHTNIIAGWETGVPKTIPVENINLTIKDLLLGFFLYYTEFDYISNVVCPFIGKVIKKSKFSNIEDLPEEMNIYKTQIKEEKIEFFRLDSPMCIQEPIDLSQNITEAVTKLHLRMFKQYCAESAAVLQTIECESSKNKQHQ